MSNNSELMTLKATVAVLQQELARYQAECIRLSVALSATSTFAAIDPHGALAEHTSDREVLTNIAAIMIEHNRYGQMYKPGHNLAGELDYILSKNTELLQDAKDNLHKALTGEAHALQQAQSLRYKEQELKNLKEKLASLCSVHAIEVK